MIYLIDGHNLIGKISDIKLSDPNDEEKLLRKLSSWVHLAPKRKIQLYFDAGEHGGMGDLLSVPDIRVQFARVGQEADDLIIRAIEKVRNRQAYTVVTSDNKILFHAKRHRIGFVKSEEFAAVLVEALKDKGRPKKIEKPPIDEAPDIDLKGAELDAWLHLFENAPKPEIQSETPALPETLPSIQKAKAEAEAAAAAEKRPPPSADSLKRGDAKLSKKDMDEWLAAFGGAPQPTTSAAEPKSAVVKPKKKKKDKKKILPPPPEDPSRISSEDRAAWLAYFGQDSDS